MFIESEISAVEGRMSEAVKFGLPEVGWSGDPNLELVFHRPSEAWVVIDRLVTPPAVILRKPAEGLRDLDFRELCTRLKRAQDNSQVRDLQGRVRARNEAIEQDSLRESMVTANDVTKEVAQYLQRVGTRGRQFL